MAVFTQVYGLSDAPVFFKRSLSTAAPDNLNVESSFLIKVLWIQSIADVMG